LALAERTERRLSALELRYELARLALPAATGRADALEVERAARELGLVALAERARALAEPSPSGLRL
jgi:hypothetical protein